MSNSKWNPLSNVHIGLALINFYHPLHNTVIAKYSNQQMFINFIEENKYPATS